MILFLVTSHLKGLLIFTLIHFLKIHKQYKFFQKQNLRNFYLLLQKNPANFNGINFNGMPYIQINEFAMGDF